MGNVLDFFNKFSDVDDAIDMVTGMESLGQEVEVIKTGSISLDDALSSGGIPKGRVVQYYGPAGSGKTLMAILAIKKAQEDDPEAEQLVIDAEQTFDINWAASLGCNPTKISILQGETAARAQPCFEFLLGVPKEDAKTHAFIGKSKEGLLDKITNKEVNVNLIILDSIGVQQPPGEDISRVGKMNIGLMARFLTTTLKKVCLEVKKANIPFIIINHVHESLDMYGPSHVFSGGNSLKHVLSANVFFEAVQRKDAQILDEKENKIGHTIRATIEKSKFGPHPRKCEFKVDFSIGVIDEHEEIATLAIDYEIIKKISSVSYEYNEKKYVGYQKLCDAIQNDKNLAEELKDKINLTRSERLEKKLEKVRAEHGLNDSTDKKKNK